MQECIQGFKSLSLRQNKRDGIFSVPLILVINGIRKGFEGGGASGSERFEGELHGIRRVCRKLNSTACCSPGRAAKGANPFLCAIVAAKRRFEAVAFWQPLSFCRLPLLFLLRHVERSESEVETSPHFLGAPLRGSCRGEAETEGVLFISRCSSSCHFEPKRMRRRANPLGR